MRRNALNIKFISDGGFNKSGAFVEFEGEAPIGDEVEFERQGYISLNLICHKLDFTSSIRVMNETEERKPDDRVTTKRISGKADIGGARWGDFSLSFLGEEKTYSQISLNIRSNPDGEAASFAGLLLKGDIDLEPMDEFYLELDVFEDRFDKLVEELGFEDAELHIHVDTARFPQFYSTWSPSVSEGRIIKFLNDKNEILNKENIPSEFWEPLGFDEKFSDPSDALVSLGVKRSLGIRSSGKVHD